MAKRFDICTPRPMPDGGTRWHRVGTAFESERGLITCYLDSYPVPTQDRNGNTKVQFSLFEPRERDDKPTNDDEAPF